MNNLEDDIRIRILRKKIIKATMRAKEGHIPSSFSILDILYCLYILLPKNTKIDVTKHDLFILSKGHASLALYAILEEVKLIGPEWVNTFGEFDSHFGGHPDKNKVTSIQASTGSLGHGLPFAIGKALARRALGIESKIYCLIGDGELNEGSIWESFLLISNYNLHELVIIIDSNKSGDRALMIENMEEKLQSFNFCVKNINGHLHTEILESLNFFGNNRPLAIIANTVKGFGISAMENNPAWHHAFPTQLQYKEFMDSLN